MTNFDRRLDEILNTLWDSTYKSGQGILPSSGEKHEAERSIRTLILEEVIGKNERTNQMESPTWNYVGGQNALRAEQRQKVKGELHD